MKSFKEWLSDYLRYFMLLLAAILVFVLVIIGVRLYRYYRGDNAQNAIEILTETQAETQTEIQTEEPESSCERGTESGMTKAEEDSQPDTESGESRAERQAGRLPADQTDMSGTERQSESASGEDAGSPIIGQTDTESALRQKETQEMRSPQTERPLVPIQTESETETETETEPQPVYMTLTGSCYLRSGPGYEYDIIGEYMYGTVVQVLDDSTGWYKVQVDGMTGYMGGRFFY